MKQLQNDFTTPEQSQRLLELGVPADSADCYWNTICCKPIPMQYGILYSDKRNQFTKENVPCWSVGRLMEILFLTYKYKEDYNFLFDPKELITPAFMLEMYEDGVKDNLIDFSKLEE